MDGWMDGRMDGLVDEWVDGRNVIGLLFFYFFHGFQVEQS